MHVDIKVPINYEPPAVEAPHIANQLYLARSIPPPDLSSIMLVNPDGVCRGYRGRHLELSY